MDTAVGCLYNFFGGSNGTRALAFFENCCTNMLESKLGLTISGVDFEKGYISMLTTLRELLRREQRSVFNEDLPKLLNSIENVICAGGIEQQSLLFQILHNMINELRGMIARAQGLIHDAEQSAVEVVSTTVVTSTFPRRIITPGGQHDNEKKDIVDIKILPTEAEIRSNHRVLTFDRLRSAAFPGRSGPATS